MTKKRNTTYMSLMKTDNVVAKTAVAGAIANLNMSLEGKRDANYFSDEPANMEKVRANNKKCIEIYIEGNKVNNFPEFKKLLEPKFVSKPTRDTGYASQGLCHAGGNVLITSYKEDSPSKLDIVNEIGQSKTIKLDVPNGAHVGGVAYHEESGNVYIPTGKKLFVYTSEDIANTKNGEKIKHSAEIDISKMDVKPDSISFVTVHGDGLYVGAFHRETSGLSGVFEKQYTSKPEIVRYQLNSDGTVNMDAEPIKYKIPDKVQGFDIVEKNGKEYFIFSTSFGRNNDSKVLICTPDENGKMQTLKSIKLPCMAEEVSINKDGQLGIVFESDCTKFDEWYDSANMEIGNVLYIDINSVINELSKEDEKANGVVDLMRHKDDFDIDII